MTDFLQWGSDWLMDKLTEQLVRAVVYGRGDLGVEIEATIGTTLFRLDDGLGGTVIQWTERDFLVDAAALVLNGQVIEPLRGDRIQETDETGTYEYEVAAYGTEPPWRWSDSYYKKRRIHCKRVSVGPPPPLVTRLPKERKPF